MSSSRQDADLSRRDFLRMAAALGGVTAWASIMEACSQAGVSPTTNPTPQPPQMDTTSPTLVEKPTSSATLEQVETQEISGSPSLTPTEAMGSGVSGVAFVRTGNRADGMRKAIELLDLNPVEGKRVTQARAISIIACGGMCPSVSCVMCKAGSNTARRVS